MSLTFTIEKNIPLAPMHYGLTGVMRSMEVGDSVFFDNTNRASAAPIAARLKPKKFAIRKVDGGFRLWRTA